MAVASACQLTYSQCQQLLVAQLPCMQDIVTCLEPSDRYGVGSISATTLCCDDVGFACGCAHLLTQEALQAQASACATAP